MWPEEIKSSQIVIVDDEASNVLLLQRLLTQSGFCQLLPLTDSRQVLGVCETGAPDLLLLDLQMPYKDGFEIMRELAARLAPESRFPILVLTADLTITTKRSALEMGADDFVTKPFDALEVVLRVKNLLHTFFLQKQLHRQNRLLEVRVRERTRELEETQVEILERLARATEYRDDDTGAHTRRVGDLSARIAQVLGEP